MIHGYPISFITSICGSHTPPVWAIRFASKLIPRSLFATTRIARKKRDGLPLQTLVTDGWTAQPCADWERWPQIKQEKVSEGMLLQKR